MSTSSSGSGSAPGERIGPYRVVRRLGVGGMGIVYEAVDTVLNRRVALKVISPHLASDPVFRARFTQEAQAQASLDSPHVVQVFAHGEVDGALYIASQLIPDGDLGAMMRRNGASPPRIAVDMLAQIATGLADAHATGLVHRDIKPANVLLRIRDDEVSAYLGDFGIARRTDTDHTMTTHGFAIGTPSYMAPELHTGGTPGPMSDVYSLGCLLWAALTGRAPYEGTTDYQLVNAHLSAPIPQLAAVGPFEREVNRILRTAMAKHPEQRHAAAAALRDDLRHLLRTIPAPYQVLPGSGQEQHTVHSGLAGATPSGEGYAVAPYGAGPTASYQHTGARPRRTGLLVGLALVAVLIVVGGGIGLVALLSDGDGDEERAGGETSATESGSETTATDPETTDPETTSPAPTGTDEHGLGPDEQRAAAAISAALLAEGDLDQAESDCTGRELVRRTGVDELVDKGVLNQDLEFIGDMNADIDPSVLQDIFAASFTCVLETSGVDPSG